MTELDREFPAEVESILKEYGKTVQLYSPSSGPTYNVDQGQVTVTVASQDVIISPPRRVTDEEESRENKDLLQCVLQAKQPILDNSYFYIDTNKYTVLRHDTTYSGELKILYRLYLEKAA